MTDRDKTPARVVLASATLRAGHGGISRVGRLTARALLARSGQGAHGVGGPGAALRVISFLDDSAPEDVGVAVRVARSSRWRFAYELAKASVRSTHYVYDVVGLGRAHPRIPFWRRPFAVWIHGVEIWERASPVHVSIVRDADLVLANSRHTLDRATALHGPLPRAVTCWLATEEEEAPAMGGPRRGPPTVLVVARLTDAYKGHAELIESWPRVVSAQPDARLVFVGGGSNLDSFRSRAALSPVAHRIDVRGFVPEQDMAEVWRDATVFAMPSRGEGFGIVYVEAMRHSIPIVASVHDAGSEINVDGVTGYNVNMDRPAELTDRLVQLLRDDVHAAELGGRGRERWYEHFRPSAFMERFSRATSDFLS